MVSASTTKSFPFSEGVKKIQARWAALPSRERRLIILLAFLGLVIWGGYKVVHTAILLRNLSADAREFQTLTENGTFALWENSPDVLEKRFFTLKNDLHELHSEVGLFAYLGPLFGWVPQYGGDLAQAPALLEFGDDVADGAYTTLGLFQGVTAQMDAGRASGKPVGGAVLDALKNHTVEIQTARLELERARAARAGLDIGGLSSGSRELVERLDRLLPLWNTAVNALALAPTLLGGKGPREYLLVVQNSDELRPTGGFISSIVNFRMENGDIASLQFRDSYAVDDINIPHPPPPEALQKYLGANALLIRDANWSPDFPATANEISQIYQDNQGLAPQGIIATNLNLVSRLLQVVGPVSVQGTNQKVDAANALATLKSYWDSPQGQGHTADWWAHRKDFTGQLLVTLLERLRNGQFDKTQFVHLLSESFASKDLLIFLNETDAQDLVQKVGWDGSLDTGAGDKLMVVDSNLGFNKVDPNITRRADYFIQLDANGNGNARVTLTYTNTSKPNGTSCVHEPYYPPTYAELQQGCYWDYLRVITTAGARLVSASEGIEAGTDDPIRNRAVFHGYFVLPRGESRQVQYEYQLPQVVTDGRTYHLRIGKQPGAPNWNVHVQVKLPDNATVFKTIPAPSHVNGATVDYDVTLDRDVDIVITRPALALSAFSLSIVLALLSVVLLAAWWFRRRSIRLHTAPIMPKDLNSAQAVAKINQWEN